MTLKRDGVIVLPTIHGEEISKRYQHILGIVRY